MNSCSSILPACLPRTRASSRPGGRAVSPMARPRPCPWLMSDELFGLLSVEPSVLLSDVPEREPRASQPGLLRRLVPGSVVPRRLGDQLARQAWGIRADGRPRDEDVRVGTRKESVLLLPHAAEDVLGGDLHAFDVRPFVFEDHDRDRPEPSCLHQQSPRERQAVVPGLYREGLSLLQAKGLQEDFLRDFFVKDLVKAQGESP